MWNINAVTDFAAAGFQIFGGWGRDQKMRLPGDPLGPEGATYVVSVKGGGSILLTDVGSTPDPLKWAVQINSTNDYWFYLAEGQLSVNFAVDGNVSFTGDLWIASARSLESMMDMTSVFPFVFAMSSLSPKLGDQWNQNPLATLAYVGLSDVWKTNISDIYVKQIDTFLRTIKTDGAPATPVQLRKLSLVGPVAVLAAQTRAALEMKPAVEPFSKWLAGNQAAQTVARLGKVSVQRVAEILDACFFSGKYEVGKIVDLVCA